MVSTGSWQPVVTSSLHGRCIFWCSFAWRNTLQVTGIISSTLKYPLLFESEKCASQQRWKRWCVEYRSHIYDGHSHFCDRWRSWEGRIGVITGILVRCSGLKVKCLENHVEHPYIYFLLLHDLGSFGRSYTKRLSWAKLHRSMWCWIFDVLWGPISIQVLSSLESMHSDYLRN